VGVGKDPPFARKAVERRCFPGTLRIQTGEISDAHVVRQNDQDIGSTGSIGARQTPPTAEEKGKEEQAREPRHSAAQVRRL
jgi:hypothetical protein